MKNKTKTLWIVLSIALLLTVSVGGTLAYLNTQSEDVENTFTPSYVACEIGEDFEDDVKSNVYVTNTGNIDAYIRAAIVVTWKDKDGNVYGGGKPVSDLEPRDDGSYDYTIVLNDGENGDWAQGSDGFWYYKAAVKGYNDPDLSEEEKSLANTSNLIDSCTPVDDKTPEGYGLNVEILAQAIQKDGSAVTVGENGGWTIAN